MTNKMLVTQGLNELKLLDSRINRAISGAKFVAAAKDSENKVGNMTKDEFNTRAKADLQSITDLIGRRKAIKAAIVASNAVTEVEVAGFKMTVADAIERKTSIEYEKTLLNVMKKQYQLVESQVNKANMVMEDNINALVTTAYGGDKAKKDDYELIAKPYREANACSMVDPIKLADEIKELENYIEGFLSEVDSALQISNCVTMIEF